MGDEENVLFVLPLSVQRASGSLSFSIERDTSFALILSRETATRDLSLKRLSSSLFLYVSLWGEREGDNETPFFGSLALFKESSLYPHLSRLREGLILLSLSL